MQIALAILIAHPTIENDMVIVRKFLLTSDGHGQRVTDAHGALEIEGLADVDRPRAGKLRAEHIGNQHAAPHAMPDHFAEAGGTGVLGIDVGRIDVARQNGEHLYIVVAQGANERGRLRLPESRRRYGFQ